MPQLATLQGCDFAGRKVTVSRMPGGKQRGMARFLGADNPDGVNAASYLPFNVRLFQYIDRDGYTVIRRLAQLLREAPVQSHAEADRNLEVARLLETLNVSMSGDERDAVLANLTDAEGEALVDAYERNVAGIMMEQLLEGKADPHVAANTLILYDVPPQTVQQALDNATAKVTANVAAGAPVPEGYAVVTTTQPSQAPSGAVIPAGTAVVTPKVAVEDNGRIVVAATGEPAGDPKPAAGSILPLALAAVAAYFVVKG